MRRYLFCIPMIILLAGCRTFGPQVPEDIILIGPFSQDNDSDHQSAIQELFDNAPAGCSSFSFAPGIYMLSDPSGIRIPSGVTLRLTGARFLLYEGLAEDGQAFLLHDAHNVCMVGGEILGSRDIWDPGVNIAGVRVTGNSSNILIDGLVCRDLSSNAVGAFGDSPDAQIREISLSYVTATNCCNVYVDYLQANKGPVPGSDRRDQGSVAFYYVNGWSVVGCAFCGSQSDGTHFYHCSNGRFINNTVAGSTMGGYFLEGCESVLACGNLIQGNGSRGATIERDSRGCTFTHNIVSGSGREGLWMPDVSNILITRNQFLENGRKDDGERDSELRVDDTAEYTTATRDIRIENNLFRTSVHQAAAILVGPGVADIHPGENIYQGPAPPIVKSAQP